MLLTFSHNLQEVAGNNVVVEEAPARSRPDFGDTKHAPNLLQGPNVDDEGNLLMER